MMTRRQFIATSSASFVAAAVRPQDGRAQGRPWYETMRRCGQLNLNERDPLTLDVNTWLDYWASLKLDALLLNGGGIVAFYPTAVPYHHRSEFLGSRDLFGELAAATKARNMRLVARMDCNYAYEDALKAHPEWFERNRDGSPRPHGESTWLFKTCMFSPYFTDQMPAIYREINARYPVDGFFTNGWPSTGDLTVCHCENCQRVYREQVGGVPPDRPDASNPLYRKYYDVYMDRVLSVWAKWQAVVTEGRPDSVYVGNLGGGIRTVKNVKRLAEVARWFNADHQGRSGDTVIWDCAQQGRVARAVMGDRTVTNVTGAYSNSRVTWRHVTKSPAETTMWMAQTTASGMVPWFHWLGGAPEDTRWKEVGHRFFTWLAANEPHFRNKRSIADIAVLYPQRTIAFYKSGTGVEHLQGLYYALLEGRFLFDFVHEDNLNAESLRRYRALLVPNAAYLSDEHCSRIQEYVRGGGSLLATFETSKYNEWGDPRRDFALADVFGASIAGATVGPVANSYMRIEQRDSPLLAFGGTALLPGAENRVPLRQTDANRRVPLTVVPYYPAFPPEMVFPRTPRTTDPAALLGERAGSRIAYLPGDIERTFWRSGNTDLSVFIQRLVSWVRGDASPLVHVEGEGVVETFAWETEPGYALHILNYTNPNMTRGFIRQFYRIGPQKVAFRIPGGRPVRSVHALRAGRSLAFSKNGEVVSFEVPGVVDYEVVALT
jgi:putative glycosyl hydrolase-like family 6 (GHL6) protein/glycosyl hydrolase family 42 (putative beta-galactosidase)